MNKHTTTILVLGLGLSLIPACLVAHGHGARDKRASRTRSRQNSEAMTVPGRTSTLLPDGRVLLVGGEGPDGPTATVAMQDPQTGKVTTLPVQLQQPRAWHTATLLPDGSVFIFGGMDNGKESLGSAESLDVSTLKLHTLPPTGLLPRAHHTTTVLTDGRLFIVGGSSQDGEAYGSAQFWDFRAAVSTDSSQGLLIARTGQTATLLADGTVLLWGGTRTNGIRIPDGEIFDPSSDSFRIQTSSPQAAPMQSPQVEFTQPSDGAESTPLNALIAIRFSERLQVQTVNSNTVTLSSSNGPSPVTITPAEGGILAFVMPQASLLPGTEYTVTLSGSKDAAGNVVADKTFSFTTTGTASGEGAGILGGTQSQASDPQDSPFRKLPPLQAPVGVTAISGQVLTLDGQPLEGVNLRAGNVRTETDRTGRFLLRDVSGSHVAMVIDGRSASQKRVTYGVFEDGVDITTGQTNVLKYTIWMTPIDTANAVTLTFPTSKETVITTPRIPGLEFHIPSGTTITDIDGNVAKQIGITPIPIAQPPFPLPPGVNVPVYFTIQPGGGYISVQNYDGPKGGWLVYPNTFHLTPGSPFDFWNYDADGKGWYIYGHGKVSSDGKSVNPDPGTEIYELTGAMVANSGLAPGSGPGQWCEWFGVSCDGDPIDLGTGLFVYRKTDLFLPDVIPIKLNRTYRPNDAASRAFGIGTSHDYDMFLVGESSTYSYIDVVFPDGARVHCPRISTDTTYTDAVFQCNSMPGPYFGATTVWNGNGWTLTRRDGMVYQFHDGFSAGRAQQGALVSITDRNGNTLAVVRDSNYNITQITSPNGRWVQFTYDSNYRVTNVQDNAGRTVQYSYDSSGRLTQVVDANNGTWKYSYDSNNNMTSLIDPRSVTYLQNKYDSQNRVITQTLADGTSTYQFSYNPSPCTSNCSGIWETDVTDPNGNIKKVVFYPAPLFSNGFTTAGSVSSVTYAAGTSISATYSYQYQTGTNLITSVTDPLNRTTSYSYDPLGNATSVTQLAGTHNPVITSMTYEDKYSQVTAITDSLSHTRSLAYDSRGNVVSSIDPLGNASTLAYNASGQLVSISDALGNTSNLTYDGGDLTSVNDPLGRTVTFFTDSAGRSIAQTNALGALTKYSYNPLSELNQITDPTGATTSVSYDSNGNLLNITDPRNTSSPTVYSYDTFNRIATQTDHLGNRVSYQYDANNNLTQFTDRRGKVAILNYDALNRRTFAGFGKTGSSYESTISYTFDAGNRLTQALDSIAGTVTRGYDSLNHVISETTNSGTISYTWDTACRRTSLTLPGQAVVNYSYDNVNRLTQITQANTTVSFNYDAANRRTSLTLPNGIAASYSYDSASELTGLTYASGSTVLGNFAYGYDLARRRASSTGSFARTNLPTPVSVSAYNASNQLTTWGTASLFYDASGNMTSDGTHSYTWDARNHLVAIDNGSSATFTYDPFGRRVSKTILGTTTTFLYDKINAVQEVIGGSNTANSLMGRTDEVFQRTDSAGSRNFLLDALGSAVALTDSTGAIQAQYTFDPFGSTTISGSSNTNTFAYTGRELDATGLYFYRARYYSTAIQRFVSEDPLGFQGGINLYSYVGNNAVNFVDPSGLDPNPVGGGHACTRNNQPTICVTNWTPNDPGWVFFPDPPASGGGGATNAGVPGGGTVPGGPAVCGCGLAFGLTRRTGCNYACICSDGTPDLFGFKCEPGSRQQGKVCPEVIFIYSPGPASASDDKPFILWPSPICS
jgi:RHS repeat-associated protein